MKLIHASYVPEGEGPFPTLLCLHGWGANALDLLGLAPLLNGGRLLTLCPQGPVSVPIGPGMEGFGWFPLIPGQPPNPVEFAQASLNLRGFLDQAVEHYPVDRERLIVAGFSQGGGMAYDLALRQPERFRGLIALSSWLPQPLADAIPKTPNLAELPTLVIHGTQDPLVDIDKARASREQLRAMSIEPDYHEFPMAHEIKPEALRTVAQWLDQRLNP